MNFLFTLKHIIRLCIFAFCFRNQSEDEHSNSAGKNVSSSHGLAQACEFACNDAKFVNERAKNDIVLLSR